MMGEGIKKIKVSRLECTYHIRPKTPTSHLYLIGESKGHSVHPSNMEFIGGIVENLRDGCPLQASANIAAAAAKSLLCPTLCDPIDSSPPGSPVPGIVQARTLEWVAISFSNAWTWKVKVKSFSHVWLLVTPWTAAYQAPPSMGFSMQQYWSGVPLPSPNMVFKYSFFS